MSVATTEEFKLLAKQWREASGLLYLAMVKHGAASRKARAGHLVQEFQVHKHTATRTLDSFEAMLSDAESRR